MIAHFRDVAGASRAHGAANVSIGEGVAVTDEH
jgi:hypothetical protein